MVQKYLQLQYHFVSKNYLIALSIFYYQILIQTNYSFSQKFNFTVVRFMKPVKYFIIFALAVFLLNLTKKFKILHFYFVNFPFILIIIKFHRIILKDFDFPYLNSNFYFIILINQFNFFFIVIINFLQILLVSHLFPELYFINL